MREDRSIIKIRKERNDIKMSISNAHTLDMQRSHSWSVTLALSICNARTLDLERSHSFTFRYRKYTKAARNLQS